MLISAKQARKIRKASLATRHDKVLIEVLKTLNGSIERAATNGFNSVTTYSDGATYLLANLSKEQVEVFIEAVSAAGYHTHFTYSSRCSTLEVSW